MAKADLPSQVRLTNANFFLTESITACSDAYLFARPHASTNDRARLTHVQACSHWPMHTSSTHPIHVPRRAHTTPTKPPCIYCIGLWLRIGFWPCMGLWPRIRFRPCIYYFWPSALHLLLFGFGPASGFAPAFTVLGFDPALGFSSTWGFGPISGFGLASGFGPAFTTFGLRPRIGLWPRIGFRPCIYCFRLWPFIRPRPLIYCFQEHAEERCVSSRFLENLSQTLFLYFDEGGVRR
ncbi:hypothetical protein CRG98_013451 [Punica granatum]|uniref:Uncharacterized protein n=1 Tax=Punica granatum TaxID=22663 RepID=A0A2I0KDD4_PUNGR|nr:hypothetical protein CRG98_013451 [Punica granatum]